MKTLKNLLVRYAHIQAPDATIKKAFVSAVENILEITLDVKQVSINKKTAHISAPSAIKSEIRLSQKEILQNVSEEVGDKNALTAIF